MCKVACQEVGPEPEALNDRICRPLYRVCTQPCVHSFPGVKTSRLLHNKQTKSVQPSTSSLTVTRTPRFARSARALMSSSFREELLEKELSAEGKDANSVASGLFYAKPTVIAAPTQNSIVPCFWQDPSRSLASRVLLNVLFRGECGDGRRFKAMRGLSG